MESERRYDYLVKLLMLGDSDVGKSSIIHRFKDDSYDPYIAASIGVDFVIKTINIDGKKVKLQIWDTAGQERYRCMSRAYYRGAMGILLVYDITEKDSFLHIANWIQNIEEDADPDVKRLLIGNKCDVEKGRVVSLEEGKELASRHNMGFYEMSAKNNINVAEAFVAFSKEITDWLVEKKIVADKSICDLGSKQVNACDWICC